MGTVPLLVTLLKATLVLVAAMAVARGLQRAAAGARYLVWLVTLGGLLLVPTLALWAPLRVAVLPSAAAMFGAPAASTPRQSTQPATSTAADLEVVPGGLRARTTGTVALGAPAFPDARPRGATALAVAARHPLLLLGALWGVVALGVAGALVRAWLVVRRIVRHARPLDQAEWRDPLWEIADRFGLDEPPRLLRSEQTTMPFACGLTRPTIVLPASSDGWAPERRLAVLLHELAHVRRRDLVGHTLARVVCAVYWFHPLVWTAARRLRAESERACDDLALICGAHAADYAEHLLDIVTAVRGDATPSVALAMARRTEFEGRMLDILDGERRRAAPSRRETALLVGALALLTVVVGAVMPVPVADARPTSSAAAPAPSLQASRPDAVLLLAAPRGAAENGVLSARAAVPSASPTRVSRDEPRVTDVVPPARANPSGQVAAADRSANPVTAQPAGAPADDRADLLARVLRTDTSASLRRVAAWGLAQHGGEPGVTAALTSALRGDQIAAVREMAAWALAETERDPAARDALTAALRTDADARVRATAAWGLGSVGDRAATEPLAAALADASPEVRARAAWALGNVRPREAPRALTALLGDADPHVRKLVAWALYTIEDPGTIAPLQRALTTEREPELQVAYVRALAAMGERSIDTMRGLLTSSDPRLRDIAVRALAGGNATGPWPWPWPQPRPFP